MGTTVRPDRTAVTATDSLDIRDSRTSKSYTIPIGEGAIRAMDLRPIRAGDRPADRRAAEIAG